MLENVQPLYGQLNRNIEYVVPKLQEKTLVPTIEEQVVVPDDGFNGFSKVILEAVTNNIDSNIIPENIKVGTEILGVQGSYEGLIPRVEEDTLVFNKNVAIEGGEIIL